MSLLNEIEPDDGHHIVIWTESGKLANIAREYISIKDSRWTVDPEIVGIEGDVAIIAAAIAFRGTRLGSWWDDDWWHVLASVNNDEAALDAAMCLQWFRLPLLHHTLKINQLARKFGQSFIRAWILEVHTMNELAYRTTGSIFFMSIILLLSI